MSDIIDLNAERDRRDGPDASTIQHGEYGRPLYTFIADYRRADGGCYSVRFLAYDLADAQEAVDGMNAGLTLAGQLHSEIEP